MKKGQTAGIGCHISSAPGVFTPKLDLAPGPPSPHCGPGRLPWLHRASPSATLDKIEGEHCDDAARRQEIFLANWRT